MKPKISIIIPCYNSARYVAETIASVKAQTSDRWDCVIVDDGSTDRSGIIIEKDTMEDERFFFVRTKNNGVAAARNLAISLCDGDYVLPLDADDRLVPKAIEKFLSTWEKHPDADLVVPQIRRFGIGRSTAVQTREWKGYENLKICCTPTNSSCFRRNDWERVGGYSDGTMYEDWEFWLRLLYGHDRVVNIPEVLVEYRVHPDSRWHKAVKNDELEVSIIKKMNPKIYGK